MAPDLRRRGRTGAQAVGLLWSGSVVQVVVLVAGVVLAVPAMFFLGALFAGAVVPDASTSDSRSSGSRRSAGPSGRRPARRGIGSPPVSERTLVLVKPDAVRRGLVGEVLGRFERKGLRIVAMDQRSIDGDLADRHYAEHVERDFYPPLREFITSGPLVAMVLEGDEADRRRAGPERAPPTGGPRPPARSAATSRCPTARTSSTPRTRRSRPPARSRSSSRPCSEIFARGPRARPSVGP